MNKTNVFVFTQNTKSLAGKYQVVIVFRIHNYFFINMFKKLKLRSLKYVTALIAINKIYRDPLMAMNILIRKVNGPVIKYKRALCE